MNKLTAILKTLSASLPLLLSPLAQAQSSSAFVGSIGLPSDGGEGPSLWYQDGVANSGSAGSSFSLTSGGGKIAITATDYFGNANGAFGLLPDAAAGAAVAGSGGLFASDNNGTVVFMFKTPAELTGFISLFNQGSFGNPESHLEVGINNGWLRLGTQLGSIQQLAHNLRLLDTNTWYYFAMHWDLSQAANNLAWYIGQAGESQPINGKLTVSKAGSSNAPIQIGGRGRGSVSLGYFQNIAIYERTLSEQAIKDQFKALVK
jgi:hypothetical protein